MEYPKDENNRHFSSFYYQKVMPNGDKYDRRWLVYSKDLDKVYCFCCKLFCSKSGAFIANQLVNEGTRDWKNIGSKLKSHETSYEHVTNIDKWIELEARLRKKNTIDKEIQEQINKEKEHWEKILNEFIELLASQIKNIILKKVKDAKYFSIILDCTPDVSHQEKMTLILRCVDTLSYPIKIEEYFLEFLQVNDTTGKGLFEELTHVLKKYDLDINDIRGYDEIAHSTEDSFRIDYILYILDQSISSIESRFEQFLEYENMFGFLFDSNKFKTLGEDELKKYCINLEKLLSFEDHSDIDGLDLFSELKLLKEIISNEISTPLKILNYIKRSYSFPNTYIAYKILLTLPITVATAKRSFSKLKLIKSYLRSTMLQDRLNGLAILSIESEILELLDYKILINNFATQKARKIT
uniref:Zinc finger MYM-type protein 5 n=1 Tax=Cajanus cajan TaxID=3821 RepID=A0A151RQ35_CAJCA|nr:Zinc finger MYM-type protein 5 [Cajanus cajan]